MHVNVREVLAKWSRRGYVKQTCRGLLTKGTNEWTNKRPRARREGRRPDVAGISRIAERFDENAIGCKVMRDALIRCQEGNGVCTVSFLRDIRLRGKLPWRESQARTLHDTPQFARHASICQCQCRWPQTWHLRLPFTGLVGWNWLARCIRFRRSMNYAIEIGKAYFFYFRGFVVVTHCYQLLGIALIDRNCVVSLD